MLLRSFLPVASIYRNRSPIVQGVIKATSQRQRRLFWLALALLILGAGLCRAFELPETDLLWEIRAGGVFLHTGTIPRVETWAWPIQGRPWLPNSWAWNVLLATVYATGNMVGLGFLNLALFCLIFALAANLLRLLGASPAVLFGTVALAIFTTLPWLTLRPQEADYALLLGWLNLAALSWRWRPRARLLWLPLAAFGASAVWMNLHLSATPAVVLFPAGLWFIWTVAHRQPWRAVVPAATLSALGAAAGLVATPFGLGGLTKGGAVLVASRNLIVEWSPVNLHLSSGWLDLLGVLLFGLLAASLALARRQWLFAAALLGFGLCAEQLVRLVPLLVFFGLLATPLLPARWLAARLKFTLSYFSISALTLLVGVALALPQLLVPQLIPALDPGDLKAIPHGARVLTTPEGGGMLLLYRPDTSPSLDSRNDLYGRALYFKNISLIYTASKAQVQQFVDSQHVSAVLLESTAVGPKPTVEPIMNSLGWTRHRYHDATVWVRPGA